MTQREREPGDDSDERPSAPLPSNVTELEPWKQSLVTASDKEGKPKLTACVGNVVLCLTHDAAFKGCFARNDLSGETELMRKLPTVPGWLSARRGPVDEYILLATIAALAHINKLSAGDKLTAQGIEGAGRQQCYNPLLSYLDGLKWDGVRRLPTWLSTYLGASRTPYVDAVGEWWLISAIARAYKPGCQADHVLVLEGPQGARKSSALRILAGERYFSDQLPDLSSKDALQHLKGIWILELGEMDALSRHDVTRIKAFLTVRSDRYRPVWGHYNEKHPRTCIFAGTTNSPEPLRDDTGNRRFWPVKVGAIDLDALERDRDQLWAEAKEAYEGGAQWWPTRELAKQITDEQEQRLMRDEWEDKIAAWCEGRDSFALGEVLAGPLSLEPGKWGMLEQRRAGSCLRRLGFEKKQRPRLVGTGHEWRWERSGQSPVSPLEPSDG